MAEVSVRYGRALYELAQENGSFDECMNQADVVRDTLLLPECRSVLEHPHIEKEEKRAFLRNIFSEALPKTLSDFLTLLIEKNRESIAAAALVEFIRLGDLWRGRVDACVVSAMHLREEQVAALQALLTRKLGKRVDMDLQVDPAVIGGFCIMAGGYAVDYTVKKRIEDMRSAVVSTN